MDDLYLPAAPQSPRRTGHRSILRGAIGFRPSLATLVAGSVVAAILAIWLSLGAQVRTDLTQHYASALLLRSGHATAIYDHAAVMNTAASAAASATSTPPSTWFPLAILALVPLTVLPLAVAYYVWTAVQALCLVASAIVAHRAASGSEARKGVAAPGLVLVSLAGVGTLQDLTLGQWDGLPTLALALAYSNMVRGRDARAIAWVVASALAGKPHLAVGVCLFMLARRPRLLVPAIATAALALAASALVAPPGAIRDLLSTVGGLSSTWRTSTTIGLPGLAASVLGDGRFGGLAGAALSALALALCVVLGRRTGDHGQLGIIFLCVTALSVVAAPHVYYYDLVLLIPGVVASMHYLAPDRVTSRPAGGQPNVFVVWWLSVGVTGIVLVWPPGSFRNSILFSMLLMGGLVMLVRQALLATRTSARTAS